MENTLIGIVTVLVLGISAQWLAWRLQLPSILLLLSFGFAAGPLTGIVDPNSLFGPLLIPFVSLSVAIILFEGGLSLNLRDLPHVGGVIRNLVTIGVFVNLIAGLLAAYYFLGLSLQLSILLGAILTVTGPTVILPLLRHIRPFGQVGPVLRWEGIVIDPIGAMLAVLVFDAILASGLQATTGVILSVVLMTAVTGGLIGVIGAGLIVLLMRQFWIPDYLENSVVLMIVVSGFALSNQLQDESGLLAVTVMGITLANQNFVSVRHIAEFKENLQLLLLGVLFILLSARLEIEDLHQLPVTGTLAFFAVMVLIGRPLGVWLSTLGSSLSWQERLFIGWMAPRGIVAAAVSAIFAIRLSESGFQEAGLLVPITFVVIIGTIIVYGLSSAPLARWLGIAQPNPQGVLIAGAHSWARDIAAELQKLGFKVVVVDSNWRNISKARMAGLTTFYGNVLSKRVLDELNLDGIGKFLALTSNNEVNSLACLHFSEVFGRYEVYQLPFEEDDEHHEGEPPSDHLRGRILFGSTMTFRKLQAAFASGARLTTTRLTKAFDIQRFQANRNGLTVPLFLVTEERQLTPFTIEKSPEPKPGQKIISLVGVEEVESKKPETPRPKSFVSNLPA
ncbi:MAG TPA: sodium:proton antiporter [Acidobacteriota bacterium]|nr:sodium:proton antiporter [Acidobacteriota bacterium]